MTITTLIPGLGGKPKVRKANRVETKLRRTQDQLAAVRQDNVKLLTRQAAADDYFALLIQDRNEVYAAWKDERRKREAAEQAAAAMQSERDELLEECAEWRVEAQTLGKRLAPFLAAEANANRVDVPPMVRDTSAIEDQATGPIYVQTLRDAAAAGLLGPVTDPGHITT